MRIRDSVLGPGIYLVAMTFCWVLPFFFSALSKFPVAGYLKSYNAFFIAFISTTILGLLVNILSASYRWWSRLGFLGRYFLLAGSYALNIFLILVVTIALDSYHLVRYFGGCAAGSFGVLYVPSVFVNFVLAPIGVLGVSLATGERISAQPADRTGGAGDPEGREE